MKKTIYLINALIAIFALVYLFPAIKTISLTEIIRSGIFGYALLTEILVSLIVIVLAIMLFSKKIESSKSLDLFSIIFLFFGLFNLIPRLMRMSFFVNDLFCTGAISSICKGNGIIALISQASVFSTIYVQFFFLVFVIVGVYTSLKKKTV